MSPHETRSTSTHYLDMGVYIFFYISNTVGVYYTLEWHSLHVFSSWQILNEYMEPIRWNSTHGRCIVAKLCREMFRYVWWWARKLVIAWIEYLSLFDGRRGEDHPPLCIVSQLPYSWVQRYATARAVLYGGLCSPNFISMVVWVSVVKTRVL